MSELAVPIKSPAVIIKLGTAQALATRLLTLIFLTFPWVSRGPGGEEIRPLPENIRGRVLSYPSLNYVFKNLVAKSSSRLKSVTTCIFSSSLNRSLLRRLFSIFMMAS